MTKVVERYKCLSDNLKYQIQQNCNHIWVVTSEVTQEPTLNYMATSVSPRLAMTKSVDLKAQVIENFRPCFVPEVVVKVTYTKRCNICGAEYIATHTQTFRETNLNWKATDACAPGHKYITKYDDGSSEIVIMKEDEI